MRRFYLVKTNSDERNITIIKAFNEDEARTAVLANLPEGTEITEVQDRGPVEFPVKFKKEK